MSARPSSSRRARAGAGALRETERVPARDPRLIVVSGDVTGRSAEPFNAETPLDEQLGLITPNAIHYVRSHFDVPRWERLVVDGAVERPLSLDIADLLAMPRRSLVVTLECAGNGRGFLDPPAPGEQWRLGAVGTAEWTGVPLRHVLALARPDHQRGVEVVFAGADAGTPKDVGERIRFERSLPMERAFDDSVLLAFAMNGEPLPPDHGAPLRLVVPGAYGMASVKWLARIAVVADPFRGFFQAKRYVLDGAPLPSIAPRAVITSPRDGAVIAGPVVVSGYCWSGGAPIARVEVSADEGRIWKQAEIEPASYAYAWQSWWAPFEPAGPGEATIVARAVDADGTQQPLTDQRDPLGYMSNAARPVTLRVGAAT
jgi:DMSO/TMAO reductase YedYZ molybdopterin-dependent catalytic subunit